MSEYKQEEEQILASKDFEDNVHIDLVGHFNEQYNLLIQSFENNIINQYHKICYHLYTLFCTKDSSLFEEAQNKNLIEFLIFVIKQNKIFLEDSLYLLQGLTNDSEGENLSLIHI